MPGLPPGWESDYDGKRWFYTYKANGHVQYHFPNEGDEFPDYIDALSPAPVLAPEERLESQQQVKRHGGSLAGSSSAGNADAKILPWQGSTATDGRIESRDWPGKMSATARPVSFVWEGDEDDATVQKGEDAVFRPESFMFLGPGVYNDVSPLAEEDDETAKRLIAGDERSKGISPAISAGTTPQVPKSELESPTATPPMAARHVTIDAVKGEEQLIPPPNVVEDEPVIHMIDSKEMPSELPGSEPWQDPVGRVAEMATGETPIARIETHPEPVEIGEGRQLTTVEPPVADQIPKVYAADMDAEALPKFIESSDSTQAAASALSTEGVASGSTNIDDSNQPVQTTELESTPQPIALEQKAVEEPTATSKYQPYKPGKTLDIKTRKSDETSPYRSSLQRERSLMMGTGSNGGQQLNSSFIPAALQVLPPSTGAKSNDITRTVIHQSGTSLSSKPATESSFLPSDNHEDSVPPRDEGITKFPSVLRPARGRALSQPRTPEELQGERKEAAPDVEQHPPMMQPGTGHARHQSAGIARKPAGSSADIQLLSKQPDSQYLPYRSTRTQGFPVAHDLPPRAATAMPASMLEMQRAASVTTRKAVPKRSEHTAPEHGPVGESSSAGRPLSTILSLPASSQQAQQFRERRHSSFSPSEVSSLASRNGSVSVISPFDSPSPMEGRRRGSSGTSLAQSPGNIASFTPSPPSLTPGSERQNLTSPLSGPPSRPGISNSSSDMSYFAQDSVPHSQQQPQSPPSGLQRSQSMHQQTSPSQDPETASQGRDRLEFQNPTVAGHHLTSIEEHDEVASRYDVRSMNSQSPDLSRRHSLAASPKPSPRLANQLVSPRVHESGNQGHLSQYQAQPLGSRGSVPPAFRPRQHVPAQMASLGSHPVQPLIQGPPQHDSNSRHQVPPMSMAPAKALHAHDFPVPRVVPPSQGNHSHHHQAQRAPGVPQIASSNNFTVRPGSDTTVTNAPKGKEKKWTKWFKPAKYSASGPQPAEEVQQPGPIASQSSVGPGTGPGQQMPWPSSHPIPQGPPPGSPLPSMPWSPNQIRPHLHPPQRPVSPQGITEKALPSHDHRSPAARQPGHPDTHGRLARAPFDHQRGGLPTHRQSMPPPPTSGEASRWSQRASGGYSGTEWENGPAKWR